MPDEVPSVSTAPMLPDETAIQNFRASLRGPLLRPGDDGYEETRRVWNGMIDRHPAMIVRPTGVADVIQAVNFARANNLHVAVRGGGHSFAGLSTCDENMVLDLSLMRGIRVNPERKIAWVQPGCRWGEVDRETQTFGLAVPGGQVSDTGVAGLTLGGGIGWLSRKYGLTIDNLVQVDVVLPDGRFATASARHNPDLFWAVRGGGGNFGVVTMFEFELHEVGPMVYGGMIAWPAERARDVLYMWRDWIKTVPNELSSMVAFVTAPPAPFIPPELQGQPLVAIALCDLQPQAQAEATTEPLRVFGPPVLNLLGPLPYTQLQSMLDESAPAGWQYYLKSDELKKLDDAAIELILAYATRMPSPQSMVQVDHLGGAIRRVKDDATAFGDRDAAFSVHWITIWPDAEPNRGPSPWSREASTALHPFATGHTYVNFLSDIEPGTAQRVYGKKYKRLVEIKRKYDPENLLCFNQNIDPNAAVVE